jgi:hypothetical protein
MLQEFDISLGTCIKFGRVVQVFENNCFLVDDADYDHSRTPTIDVVEELADEINATLYIEEVG